MVDFLDTDDMGFVRLGQVTLDPAVLDLAKEAAASIGPAWIVTFSWAEKQSVRSAPGQPDVDVGPGLCVGGFRLAQIPEEFIHRDGNFRYAIQIPEDVLLKHERKRIEYDPNVFGRLKLT